MGICNSVQCRPPLVPSSPITNIKLVDKMDFEIYIQKWNLSSAQIQLALRATTIDKMFVNKTHSVEDKMKLFLYAKGVLDSEPMLREYCLKKIFGNRDQSKAFERLHRIVETGEVSSNEAHGFENFLIKHSVWQKDVSFVVFRDHILLENKNAYREACQLSSLCYTIGSSMMFYLLVTMQTNDVVGMVDISEYLRKHMDSEGLRNHIEKNVGGASIEFLRTLLQLPNQNTFEKPSIMSCDIPQYMKTYGPGLISSFEVWSDFYDQTKDTHYGQPFGVIIGYHSMLLIGYRVDTNGKILYLLQNWWVNKIFVEVDPEYLRACGAIITFVTSQHTKVPDAFTMNYHKHVESLFDACEFLPYEDKIQ